MRELWRNKYLWVAVILVALIAVGVFGLVKHTQDRETPDGSEVNVDEIPSEDLIVKDEDNSDDDTVIDFDDGQGSTPEDTTPSGETTQPSTGTTPPDTSEGFGDFF